MNACLKKYNVKPCVVVVEKMAIPKIQISITSSEEDESLSCFIDEVNPTTFNICVEKRKYTLWPPVLMSSTENIFIYL